MRFVHRCRLLNCIARPMRFPAVQSPRMLSDGNREILLKTFHTYALATLLAAAPFCIGAQEAQTPEPVPLPKQSLTFMDSKLFDAKLSKELDAGKDQVEIEVSGKVPLSAIPGRLDKWITRVGETGNVEVREGATRTRALFALLPMLFSGFQAMNEERTLEPAKHYDATIIYKRDQGGDTVIDRIIFKRKKAQ